MKKVWCLLIVALVAAIAAGPASAQKFTCKISLIHSEDLYKDSGYPSAVVFEHRRSPDRRRHQGGDLPEQPAGQRDRGHGRPADGHGPDPARRPALPPSSCRNFSR